METAEAPPPAAFKPAPPRGVRKTGIPTDGYWVVAGLPKGGKTSLAGNIPGAYIIELEKGGADRISGWIQDVGSMTEFREALACGFENPEAKIIVIDTLDVVLRYLSKESAKKFGLENISEKKEGVNGFAVWEDLLATVEKMTEAFKDCGKLVILLAHFKEPKMDDGKLVVTQSIEAPSSRISSHVCSHADAIGVCAKKRIGDKSRYEIRFHGDGVVGAYGSRIPELEDKTVVLPKGGQWAAIMELFNAPAAENGMKPAAAAAKWGKK